jgi:hypothetical protein
MITISAATPRPIFIGMLIPSGDGAGAGVVATGGAATTGRGEASFAFT